MKYIGKKFSVPVGSEDYRRNFEKIFKTKKSVKSTEKEVVKDEKNVEQK